MPTAPERSSRFASCGRNLGRVTAIGLPLLAAHVGLLLLFDLSAHLLPTLLLLGLGFLALIWAERRLGCLPASGIAGVLLVAAMLRALLLPLPPTLSDDLLRYVWDGRVADAGFNPYDVAPEDRQLAALRDSLWRRMPHKNVPTVYPPLALGFFSIAALLPAPQLALKSLWMLADLVTILLLWRLSIRWRLPASRIVWYAWNPLVVLEVAAMGHVDALGTMMVVATVCALASRPRRIVLAALAGAAGVLSKLAPLVALPHWARRSGRPVLFSCVAGALLAAVGLPVLAAVGGVPPGLVIYGVRWEFNGPIFEPLWRALDALGADVGAKALLDAYKELTRQWTRWNWIYPYLYPQLLAKVLLAGGVILVIVRSVLEDSRRTPLLAGTGRLFGVLLLLSATVYPWYLLWVLPWAALASHRALRLLSATVLLSYVPQWTGVALFPWIFLLIWLPFWLALALGRRWPGTEETLASPASPDVGWIGR